MNNPLDDEGTSALVVKDAELKALVALFKHSDLVFLADDYPLRAFMMRVMRINSCKHESFICLVDISTCSACGVMT